MKHLKVQSLLEGFKVNENVLYENSLKSFFMDLTRELLFCDKVEIMEDFTFDVEHLFESFNEDYYWTIGLSNGIYLGVDISLYGPAKSEEERKFTIEIKSIVLNLQDTSEINIDLSENSEEDNRDISNYIIENIIL
jgi:hypothetical protein